jgi:hypothetical protein
LKLSSVKQNKFEEKYVQVILLQTTGEGHHNQSDNVENSEQLEDTPLGTKNWTYWKIRPPPKRKVKMLNGLIKI